MREKQKEQEKKKERIIEKNPLNATQHNDTQHTNK
jgi:hypothetical protein